MKFTEEQLKTYASPISQTEEDRCKNALRMVRDAMKVIGYSDDNKEIRLYESDTYAYSLEMRSNNNKELTLLVQGSYANNTNVRTQSDVDLAVILESTFIPEYRPGVTRENFRFTEGTFSAKDLKDDVQKALNAKFNNQGVKRGDKSIKVSGNSYRVDADVVPCYRLRDYRNNYTFSALDYVGGIEIRPDSGGKIRNFPEQHIKNGRTKNNNTNYYFKKHVRIMKKIKSIMEENGYQSAKKVSSFGVESLLWNIPNEYYVKYSIMRYTFDELIQYLFNNQLSIGNFKEVNGIKSMFEDKQKGAADYLNFIRDIKSFYQYDI